MVNAATSLNLPMILASSNDSVFIYDIDINNTKVIVKDVANPVKINYFVNEKWLLWINQKQELIQYDILKSALIKLSTVSGKTLGLTVDWLERSLYYVEFTNGSTIFKVDLNYINEGIHKVEILSRKDKIVAIEVSPFRKSLYWFELKQSESILMQSKVDGTSTKPFFKEKGITNDHNKNCNCSSSDVEPVFALDHSSNPFEPSLVFLNGKTRNFFLADSKGCICRVIARNMLPGHGFKLKNLKVDFGMLYWTNQNKLNALDRKHEKIFSTEVRLIYILKILKILHILLLCKF